MRSCLYQPLQEVLLHHLLDVVSCSAPERFLALGFAVSGAVRSVAGRRAAVERCGPDAGFAAEHLTEHSEEGQELLDAADPKQSQSQASRLPR